MTDGVVKFDPANMEGDSILTPLGPVECRFLAIDDSNLHTELDRSAADLAFFSGWEATAEWAVADQKQELDATEALAWMELKSRRDDGEKFTADDMRASVKANPRVRALKRELLRREHELSQFKTMRIALWRKGDLIQTKVHLRRSEMTREMSAAAASGALRNTQREVKES